MKKIKMFRPVLNLNDLNTIIEFCSHDDNIELGMFAKIEYDNNNEISKAVMLQDDEFVGYIQKRNNNLFYIDKLGDYHYILSNNDYDRINNIVKEMFFNFEWKTVKIKEQTKTAKENIELIFN